MHFACFFIPQQLILAVAFLSLGFFSCLLQMADVDTTSPDVDENFHAVGKRGFSPAGVHSLDLVITPDGIPVVGFAEGSHWGRATVMQFDDASGEWKKMGDAPLSQGMAERMALTMTSTGILFAAFNDQADSNRITVKRWHAESGRWTIVGKQGISPPGTMQMDLAASPEGRVFLAFKDDTQSLRATVLRYDDANDEWVVVGKVGFTDAEVNFLSLAVDPSGKPYIGYYDEDLAGKPTVMSYQKETDTWEIVGERGFTTAMTAGNVLAIDRAGRPYLAFSDGEDFTFKLTVMSWDSIQDWLPVGGAGFSPDQANGPSLAFNTQDRPYVAFSDQAKGGAVRVMRLLPSGKAWETIGRDSLSQGISYSISLAFGKSEGPWVAFTEGSDSRITVLKYGRTRG